MGFGRHLLLLIKIKLRLTESSLSEKCALEIQGNILQLQS